MVNLEICKQKILFKRRFDGTYPLQSPSSMIMDHFRTRVRFGPTMCGFDI